MLTRRHLLLLAGSIGLLIETPALGQDRMNVVATFSILGDLVKNVGGDGVEVSTLVGPNGDVHVYLPTPGDARKLAAAKVVFVNGLGLEGWLTRLISASSTKASIVIASKGIKPRKMKNEHDTGDVSDPHAWQSVANAKIYVANIRDGIRLQKIPAVFMENITDPRLMEEIARETGATIGGTLYSDALSDPSGPAGTYIEMMRHNVSEFSKALTN